MTRGPFRFILTGLLFVPLATPRLGGWAAITVDDLPDYVVARQPVNLIFTVRQHGVTPLSGLKARVGAQAGDRDMSVPAAAGRGTGQYVATLTLPESGEWTITIHSGFGNSNVTLLPLRAVDPGSPPPLALPDAERGRRLFVAKGCVACHLHRDVNETSLSVGPELTDRRYPPDYLKQFLANPPAFAS